MRDDVIRPDDDDDDDDDNDEDDDDHNDGDDDDDGVIFKTPERYSLAVFDVIIYQMSSLIVSEGTDAE